MAIGDIHLGCLGDYMPNLYKRQLKTLKKACDLAIERGVGHVFLMGDLFDSPYPGNHLVIALRRLLYSYRRDLHFHMLIGNHDWKSSEHHALQFYHDLGLTKLFNFTVYTEPKIVEIDGVKLFICSHPHIMDVPSKKIDWCLGHFAWNGALADNGRAIDSDNQPKGRWILGDFHTHQEGNRYVYCGSLTQILWNEKLPKGVILFDEEDWQFVPITPSYKLDVVEVGSDADLAKLDDKTLWSVRTLNNYTLPVTYKRKHNNIVHLTAARQRKDQRAAVLLAKEDSVLRNPMHLLSDYVSSHKASLTEREVAFAMKYAKKLHIEAARK